MKVIVLAGLFFVVSGRYATTFAELRYRPIAAFVDFDRKELVAHLCLIVLMKRA